MAEHVLIRGLRRDLDAGLAHHGHGMRVKPMFLDAGRICTACRMLDAVAGASRQLARRRAAGSERQAQLSCEPTSSGADAATDGWLATATSAPDFTPLGIVTVHLSRGITTA